MIIAELPYVSEYLKETIEKAGLPAVKSDNFSMLFEGRRINAFNVEQVVSVFREEPHTKLFTNSENSISWISRHLGFTHLPKQIEIFKNKVKFRDFMSEWHPDYFYREIPFEELESYSIKSFPDSFIVKPSVGFFSMGVYRVNNREEWPEVVKKLLSEVEQVRAIYPPEVFSAAHFIAEEIIDGEEYAFDAYFNEAGEAVLLNVFHHPFSSGEDVSDRVYLTSGEIVLSKLKAFTDWLTKIGNKAGLRNFPLHVELRVDKHGNINPIEVNPMRFGGFCTTADCTAFAYDFNPYLAFFGEEKPDWQAIFRERKTTVYALIVLNNASGIDGKDIHSFDYGKLEACLEKPLEVRALDFRKFPLFGFVFAESRADNYAELEYLLHSDLREFIISC